MQSTSEYVEFEMKELKAGGTQYYTYQLTPKLTGVLPISRANITYTAVIDDEFDDGNSVNDDRNKKHGISSLYLSDNDAPFNSLSHQFYHTKLTDNYFDTPSQLSYLFFSKQYNAQEETKYQVSQQTKYHKNTDNDGDDDTFGYYLDYLNILNYIETIPLPYVFYRQSQINNVKMTSKTPSTRDDDQDTEDENKNKNNKNNRDKEEEDDDDEDDEENDDDSETDEKQTDANKNENSNNNNNKNNNNGRRSSGNINNINNINNVKKRFDTNAEMSKFVYDSNILLNVDFGCIEVLNGSQYRRAIASHIWQWVVVVIGFIGAVLVPLHQFYKNQGNFDDIPLIGQSIVQPIIVKIDQVVLPFVLEKLGQQIPGLGNSGGNGSNSSKNNSNNSKSNQKSSGSNNNNKNNTGSGGNTKGNSKGGSKGSPTKGGKNSKTAKTPKSPNKRN